MVFTTVGDKKINCRHYEVGVKKDITETEVKNQSMNLNEIGPRFDLTFRRDQIASSDLYKNACKQPKVENPEKKKHARNTFTN